MRMIGRAEVRELRSEGAPVRVHASLRWPVLLFAAMHWHFPCTQSGATWHDIGKFPTNRHSRYERRASSHRTTDNVALRTCAQPMMSSGVSGAMRRLSENPEAMSRSVCSRPKLSERAFARLLVHIKRHTRHRFTAGNA
jgi:hypothetical protein